MSDTGRPGGYPDVSFEKKKKYIYTYSSSWACIGFSSILLGIGRRDTGL